MIKKIDLRVIRTKKLIKNAFLSLIKQIKYEKITVQDITNEALINRNTFYLHYFDKVDLVNKLIDESLERIEDSLSKNIVMPKMLNKEYFSLLLHTLFQTIESDKEFFQIMLNDNMQSNFSNKMKKVLTNHIVFNDKNIKVKVTTKEEIILEYMISGIIGVIIFWINNSEIGITETTDFLCEIHFSNVTALLKL